MFGNDVLVRYPYFMPRPALFGAGIISRPAFIFYSFIASPFTTA
jgi:hypothetical protein